MHDETYLKSLREWMQATLGGHDLLNNLAESDWLMIIKMHAMIESALNSTLVAQFGVPELEKVIARLDTSDGARGKAAFAKALCMLDKPAVAFIQKLSELRNKCVHDIHNFGFDLNKHVATLDAKKRNALRNAVSSAIPTSDIITVGDVPMKGEEIVALNLKLGLFCATMSVMVQLHQHHEKCSRRDSEAELCRTKAKRFDEQNPPKPTAG